MLRYYSVTPVYESILLKKERRGREGIERREREGGREGGKETERERERERLLTSILELLECISGCGGEVVSRWFGVIL